MKKKSAPSIKTMMALAISGLLAACSSSDQHDEHHDHAHNQGGRLIYSLNSAPGLLMFDQTLEQPAFVSTKVNNTAQAAQLLLANDGLTFGLLEGNQLSLASSGLEHLHGDHAHTHEVELKGNTFPNVQRVITTDHYFSTLSGNTSDLIQLGDGSIKKSWTPVVYPTLALKGGDFLKFTADPENSSLTHMSVVDQHGDTGAEGRIFVRPNNGGYLTPSFTCAEGVAETAQTDVFTVILCGDGTLRWLISGYLAPEGHPLAGQTLHVTQRYPATDNRREGAIGEVAAGANGFITGISHLRATHHAKDVILAWSADQLWLINAHNDHPHRGNLMPVVGEGFGNILAATATTEDDALAVLSDTGKVAISRFEVNSSSNPVAKGEAVREQLGSAASWGAGSGLLVPGSYAFYAINKNSGTLYKLDAHAADDDYHLHDTHQHDSLKNISSAVFAQGIEDDKHTGSSH